ncbi:MAG: cyanophycinase [Anaerolinea sp.]|nr:cyanophycinase [Anaerolinea sp.]
MGLLMAMGGAVALDGAAMAVFLDACAANGQNVAILPTASALPDAGAELAAVLTERGLRVNLLPVHSREQANDPELVAVLRQAGAIFMTGGNQLRLTACLGGTLLHQAMLQAWRAGAVVAGTSAGAAVLSAIMIAYGRSGSAPRPGLAQFAPGLGFREDLIFDQHFRQRNRLGRLLYALAFNPGLLGVGVDENTVAVLDGQMVRVVGAGAVTIADGQSLKANNVAEITNGLVAISGVMLHVLTSGSVFDVQTRTASIPVVPLSVE